MTTTNRSWASNKKGPQNHRSSARNSLYKSFNSQKPPTDIAIFPHPTHQSKNNGDMVEKLNVTRGSECGSKSVTYI